MNFYRKLLVVLAFVMLGTSLFAQTVKGLEGYFFQTKVTVLYMELERYLKCAHADENFATPIVPSKSKVGYMFVEITNLVVPEEPVNRPQTAEYEAAVKYLKDNAKQLLVRVQVSPQQAQKLLELMDTDYAGQLFLDATLKVVPAYHCPDATTKGFSFIPFLTDYRAIKPK